MKWISILDSTLSLLLFRSLTQKIAAHAYRSRWNLFLAVTFTLAGFSGLRGQELFTSSSEQVHFLELYSTQSCNSCPPAQEWVSRLRSDAQLWKTFIPVVFHVDYWDYLGWKDPYSDRTHTRRQTQYAKEIRSAVYTPMFVLDGKEFRKRSSDPLKTKGRSVGVLQVRRVANDFYIHFNPVNRHTENLEVYYSVTGNGIRTRITAGENRGRTLTHNFLSLKFGHKKMTKKETEYLSKINLDLSETKSSPDKAIVFWISEENSLKPIQVVGGPIGD